MKNHAQGPINSSSMNWEKTPRKRRNRFRIGQETISNRGTAAPNFAELDCSWTTAGATLSSPQTQRLQKCLNQTLDAKSHIP